jgi:hypothetical protein
MLERFRRRVQARRQQRIGNLRQRVTLDAERARLHLVAAIIDARRVGAPIPAEVGEAMVTLAGWTHRLNGWAAESES